MGKLTKPIKVRISEELYQQLKTIAEQEQRSLSQVVRIGLTEWVEGSYGPFGLVHPEGEQDDERKAIMAY